MIEIKKINLRRTLREPGAYFPLALTYSLHAGVDPQRRPVCKARARMAMLVAVILIGTVFMTEPITAQQAAGLEGRALVEALRQGGYNIYFRHAATDWSQSDQVLSQGDWTNCDPNKMRQLSDAGRQTARSVGAAMRALKIPVEQVLASPYCRTVETARDMNLGVVETTTDIMNLRVARYFGGKTTIVEHTRRRLATLPQAAANTVLVAHGNVLVAATDVYPQEAEAVVFQPAGNGNWIFVARITPQEWLRLADAYGEEN